MKGYLVSGLCLLFLLLIGCSPYGTEDVSFGYKCDDVGRLAMFMETGVDEAILESCKEICISNLMTYSGSYKCDPATRDLSCVCSVTPERIEQKKIYAEKMNQKMMDNACYFKCASYNTTSIHANIRSKEYSDHILCLCQYKAGDTFLHEFTFAEADELIKNGLD